MPLIPPRYKEGLFSFLLISFLLAHLLKVDFNISVKTHMYKSIQRVLQSAFLKHRETQRLRFLKYIRKK